MQKSLTIFNEKSVIFFIVILSDVGNWTLGEILDFSFSSYGCSVNTFDYT